MKLGFRIDNNTIGVYLCSASDQIAIHNMNGNTRAHCAVYGKCFYAEEGSVRGEIMKFRKKSCLECVSNGKT